MRVRVHVRELLLLSGQLLRRLGRVLHLNLQRLLVDQLVRRELREILKFSATARLRNAYLKSVVGATAVILNLVSLCIVGALCEVAESLVQRRVLMPGWGPDRVL